MIVFVNVHRLRVSDAKFSFPYIQIIAEINFLFLLLLLLQSKVMLPNNSHFMAIIHYICMLQSLPVVILSISLSLHLSWFLILRFLCSLCPYLIAFDQSPVRMYQVNETEQFGAPPSKMTLGIVHHGRWVIQNNRLPIWCKTQRKWHWLYAQGCQTVPIRSNYPRMVKLL
jgi:hypothetical protein